MKERKGKGQSFNKSTPFRREKTEYKEYKDING